MSWGRSSEASHPVKMRWLGQTASLCSESWWLLWTSSEMSCGPPNSNWCNFKNNRVRPVAHSVLHLSPLCVSYSIHVIYCSGQRSPQTVDSLLEELQNQLDILKKGFTGGMLELEICTIITWFLITHPNSKVPNGRGSIHWSFDKPATPWPEPQSY